MNAVVCSGGGRILDHMTVVRHDRRVPKLVRMEHNARQEACRRQATAACICAKFVGSLPVEQITYNYSERTRNKISVPDTHTPNSLQHLQHSNITHSKVSPTHHLRFMTPNPISCVKLSRLHIYSRNLLPPRPFRTTAFSG